MPKWLDRLLPGKRRAAEGEYRPGPYALSDGWLSASAGRLMNWWQAGHSLSPYGESGAMVEACVSAYAQTVAMCPGGHWMLTPDGGRQRVENSPLSRVLKRPNDYESISDFLLNLVECTYRRGEAHALAVRDGRGDIVELHRMRQGYPHIGVDGSVFYSLSGNEVAESRFNLSLPVPARDVLHIRLKSTRHVLRGESPILAVALDQALSGAMLNQQVTYFLNEARPSWMLETDEKLTTPQILELRAAWEQQTRGDNAGGTPILAWGLKAKPVPTVSSDARLADLLKLTDQNVALAFRMPLQVLGIGGVPFASTEALMSAWKSTGLGFILNHIEEAFGSLFRLKGLPHEYLEFDTDALLRSSFKEMIDALTAGTGKVLTSNEARARIGLGRKDGGDELYVQLQDVPLSMAGKMQAASAAQPVKALDGPELQVAFRDALLAELDREPLLIGHARPVDGERAAP